MSTVDTSKPLHIIAHSIGILPTLSTKKVNKTGDYIRGIFCIIIFLAIVTYNLYGKFFVFGQHVNKTVLFTYALSDITATTVNVCAVFSVNLCNGPRVRTFMQTLRHLEILITSKKAELAIQRKFMIQFVSSNICMILFFILNGYEWHSYVGWDVAKYFLLKDFQNYHVFITSYLLAHYGHLICYRMKDLNVHLRNVLVRNEVKSFMTELEINHFQRRSRIKRIDLQQISETFTIITELIEAYGDIFGLIFVLMYSNITMNILVPLNMALLNVRGIRNLYNGIEFELGMVIVCVAWICFPCIFAFFIFSACHNAAKEAGKVPGICYCLIRQLNNHNDYKLKDELERYANQADRLTTSFSAAGCFNINFGMGITLFGSVLSYIIVLTQFH